MSFHILSIWAFSAFGIQCILACSAFQHFVHLGILCPCEFSLFWHFEQFGHSLLVGCSENGGLGNMTMQIYRENKTLAANFDKGRESPGLKQWNSTEIQMKVYNITKWTIPCQRGDASLVKCILIYLLFPNLLVFLNQVYGIQNLYIFIIK